MLLELYILFQLVAIVALVITFFAKTPLAAAVSMVTSGILMVGAWTIEISNHFVYDAAIRAYEQVPNIVSTPYLAGFNILLFGLSIVFFFNDLMEVIKGDTKKFDSKS